MDPGFALAYFNRAGCRINKGQYAAAIPDLETFLMIGIEPDRIKIAKDLLNYCERYR